ncbi:anthrone oxygenase family protein [Chitinophaga sp. 22321]|uniref:DUF1772 domain-containing protein n=1 Tax=Chitinophaga hostae TaxID=2831022 RepID=A0ABS5J747_9BACT|nr:anthrone oxygenase family protein [Chitinophaga hostae]MBS0031044.1 DUF1772 domain-containing protein [Chitinophaga hostae]
MLKFSTLLLIITATFTALMAGLFYAWSVSVTNGIGRLPDSGYLTAMQVMNRAILNPAFLGIFMSTLILLPVCTYLYFSQPLNSTFWCLLLASLFYGIGVFGVTMVGNVPLNDALDAFNISGAGATELAAMRAKFESTWNSLNLVRTVCNTISLVFTIIACISSNK